LGVVVESRLRRMSSNMSKYQEDCSAIRRGVRASIGLLRTARLRLLERFVTIPTSIVTNAYAFSFADAGWHYYRELLAAYAQNADANMRETTFFRFFKHEEIRSVRFLDDLLFLHDPSKRQAGATRSFYLGTYPWGEWGRDVEMGGYPFGHHYDKVEGMMTRDSEGYRRNPWYQPGDEHPLEIEWEQYIRVYKSVRRAYRPAWHGTYPQVVLLVRNDGEMRAVVDQGQHRVTSLSHLGHSQLVVVVMRDSMSIIRENDVDSWYFVRSGLCSRQRALLIFNAFFELNGRERINYLNLPTVY